MTTSKSRNSVGPVRFPKLSAYNVNFIQPSLGQTFWYVKFRKWLDFHLRANPLGNLCETNKSEIK